MDPEPDSLVEAISDPAESPPAEPAAADTSRGWGPPGPPPTTLLLVRHGVTPHTVEKRFSGGLRSANPGLSDLGRQQVRASAEWLSGLDIDAVVASPVRRTLESAEILAEVLGQEIEQEAGFAEMEFGEWDGLTFAEVAERYRAEMASWLGAVDIAPPGGESFLEVRERVMAGLERTLAAHAGKTVAVVSHVTPIKTLVAHALGSPLEALYRMELTPASVSVISFYEGGGPGGDERVGSLRLFNARPGDEVLPPRRH